MLQLRGGDEKANKGGAGLVFVKQCFRFSLNSLEIQVSHCKSE